MSVPNEPEWKRKLHDLEAQMNQTRPLQSNSDTSESIQSLYQRAVTWFQQLPKEGQIAVAVAGAVLGLSVLGTLVKLVSFALSLVLLGGLLYIGYKFFLAPSSQDRNGDR